MTKIIGSITSFEEAMLIMHSARLGLLPINSERLNNYERNNIDGGSIFCFIEREHGFKRWTDGKVWSPSKINNEFLLYQEVPKHLSKNAIKKQKLLAKSDPNLVLDLSIKDAVDGTTLHKKTVSIVYEGLTYHLISYYRPLFGHKSLLDTTFFKKLKASLEKNPELKSDAFLKENLHLPDFYKKYEIETEFRTISLEDNKRLMLEQMAAEVLCSLAKRNPNKRRN